MAAASAKERCSEILAGGFPEAARRWAGPLIGCFPVYTPVELFHAAGVLPVGFLGAGGSVELTHADARFQSFVCSIAKSSLEMGFQKRLEGVSGVVFHSVCDVARNLASVFRRNFPDLFVEYVHFAQNQASAASEDYAISELSRVNANVEKWFKRTAGEGALASSIRAYNRPRALMRALYEMRSRSPERVPAAEAYLLVRAGTLLPPEEHTKLLEQALTDFERRDAKRMDRVRVIVEGAFCEQPPIGLIEMLERAGCYVLDDDWLSGWRWFSADVDEDGDPLRALARAYLRLSRPSSVRHDPSRPRHLDLVRRVREQGAQAVIFMPAKFCEPALFDYVLHRRTLEREGIPHLVVEFEEKMWTFERTRTEIETFAESLLFE